MMLFMSLGSRRLPAFTQPPGSARPGGPSSGTQCGPLLTLEGPFQELSGRACRRDPLQRGCSTDLHKHENPF